MKPILYFRAVLEIIGAKDSTFDEFVPSPLEFTMLEACIPILEQLDQSSKLLSEQKEPIFHQIIVLFQDHKMITKVIDLNQGCKKSS